MTCKFFKLPAAYLAFYATPANIEGTITEVDKICREYHIEEQRIGSEFMEQNRL